MARLRSWEGNNLHNLLSAAYRGTHHARVPRVPTRVILALLLASALLGVVGRVAAQEPGAPAQSAVPVPDRTPLPGSEDAVGAAAASGAAVSTADFVRMVVVLAAVLGVIYLLFLLIKRGASGRVSDSDLISLLGSRSLGGSRNLHLVQVGNGYYLVGAADQAISLIAAITDQESIDTLKLDLAGNPGTGRRRFAELLADAGIGGGANARTSAAGHGVGSGRRHAADAADAAAGTAAGFMRHQRARLRSLRRPPLQGDAGAAD